jgi:hypothetical protein
MIVDTLMRQLQLTDEQLILHYLNWNGVDGVTHLVI